MMLLVVIGLIIAFELAFGVFMGRFIAYRDQQHHGDHG